VCDRNSEIAELKVQSSKALMSSFHPKYPAKYCIDGSNKAASGQLENMCYSEWEPTPWFAIDYGDQSRTSVGKVVLLNRAHRDAKDKLRNVEIRMADELPCPETPCSNKMFKGGHLIATYKGPAEIGQEVVIESTEEWEEIVGRYLIIQMDHTRWWRPISLQEVTVYGKQCEY